MRDIEDEREKDVALVWDEISLQPALVYNKARDKIVGFEDWGHRRTRKIADHAIVFYLRSLKTGQKMPLGYGFCESATKTNQLLRCIKEWLSNIIICGLNPIATICDQGSANISAINALIADSNVIRCKKGLRPRNTFVIKGQEVVPLYDYVHLLKGIRNNLLTKDLEIDFKNTCTKSKKFASLDDICTAYDIDTNSYVKQRQLSKITEKHVNVKFIPKMRVKYASQIFSNTLANNMDVILNLCGGIVHTRKGMMTLSSSAAVTSDVLHFFNDLFDSFNGKQQQGLSSFISDNSGHMQFWQEACKKLINMRFVDKDTKKAPRRNTEKCLANWVWTIKAAKEIWNTLHWI